MGSSSTAYAFTPSLDGHVLPPHRQARLRLIAGRSEIVAPRARNGAGSELKVPSVAIAPANGVKRRTASWAGMHAEIVQTAESGRIEFSFHASSHLLVLHDRGSRREGDTTIEGLPSSSLRDLARKFVFVPAGKTYRDWHEMRSPSRVVFFYIDPESLPAGGELELSPRLFFENEMLLSTAQKMIATIEAPETEDHDYLEALGRVLAHELAGIDRIQPRKRAIARGGLATWQQRVVGEYIEEHLADAIPLATLAELVGLSTYHFCRAFKQSFGMPPHRFHTSRRIERAKSLLAQAAPRVTDIGLTVGFSETSSFTAAFRKATGFTPPAYHRSLS